ncbi:AAA family ATPase [Ornithinimicrobium murale]|uniref:AAA family ATPase n=1 Tax=Ornithinimicrobium murale TaxID=1050153 RepID=UPI000E0DAD33|nr:AAA family ATPase [Ornithinimicrobium murale]
MNTTSPSILDGFGFDSRRNEAELPVPQEPTEKGHEPHTHRPLVRDSIAAQTLYQIISGQRVILIDSPPGGGKTSTLTTVISHLANRFGQDLPEITVATPRREQAMNLYQRLTDVMHPAQISLAVRNMEAPKAEEGALTASQVKELGRGRVSIRTVASLKRSRTSKQQTAGRKLLLIDEGYQVTFAEAAAAASGFDQVVMVGDPGQIGPVVTVDTGAWESLRRAPHRRAPEAFATMDFATRMSMGQSYRLGPDTVAAIAPLYPFDFASARPQRGLIGLNGQVLPELGHVTVSDGKHSMDPRLLSVIVERVAALVGSTAVDTDSTGQRTSSVLTQTDVTVVVALNTQVTMLSGMLAAAGLDDVLVGTADKIQGGEWRAVVALDPMAGGSASEHHMAPGRLCVMASRHTTHLSWVHDGQWARALDEAPQQSATVRTSRKVRKALTRNAL